MKRHYPVLIQVSPLQSLPVPYHQHQNRQIITYGQIQKNNTETSFTLKRKKYIFYSSPERIKYFFELYFSWENEEKIMAKERIHVPNDTCVCHWRNLTIFLLKNCQSTFTLFQSIHIQTIAEKTPYRLSTKLSLSFDTCRLKESQTASLKRKLEKGKTVDRKVELLKNKRLNPI